MKKKLKRSILMLFLAMIMITILPTSASAATSKTTPGKVTLTKVSSSAYNKITINWKKTSNATNYVIYYKKSGASKWTKLATVSSSKTSYTHTSSKKYPITVGQNYTYTVRAYNSKSKKYGSYNTKGLTSKTIPSTVKLGKATLNSSKTAVTITWNKTSGCNYYVIYRKAGSSSKWTKLATVKSSVLKYTDKNPVKGVKNTYTVRSYYSKTKVYGKYNTKGVSVTMPAIKVSKVALNKSSATLKSKGQTVQLTATVTPSNATNKALEWKSSNTKVATVSSSGKVTAVANGTATITATAKDGSKKSASCKVTVNISPATVPVSSVSLNKTSVTLTEQFHGIQLTATVTPSNASNKALEWKSSNTNVATVDSSGGVIALANGTATITATAKDGSNKSASCKVIVNIPPPSGIIEFIRLDKTSLEFTGKGQTATLKATPLLGDYTPAPVVDDINKTLIWESYDPAIATVDPNGNVTAVGNGMTTIVVTSKENNYAVAYCRVTVNIQVSAVPTAPPKPTVKPTATPVPTATPTPTPSLEEKCSVQLEKTSITLTRKGSSDILTTIASYPSEMKNFYLTWTSSDPTVATVEDGRVTAVSNGTCTITVETPGGYSKSTCTVIVDIPPWNIENVSLAGNKGYICSIHSEDVDESINIRDITFEVQGDKNCVDYYEGYWNEQQTAQIKALKKGFLKIIAKYNGNVIKTWNITVTSNWDVYIAYENWKRGVEAKIWNSSMDTVQKLDALESYIKTEFKYSMDSPGASNRLYAYQYMMCDCFGASDMFGDMAKDINPNLQVGYVDYPTGKIYTYMSDAVANSHGHMCNAVYINGQWVGYDAQPPVNG